MPLDIRMFREDQGGNPEKIKESQRRRFASVELIDNIISKDDIWRRTTGAIDLLKKERNSIQKDVAKKMKAKESCDEMVKRIKDIGDEIIQKEQEKTLLKNEIDSLVGKVGNIVDDTVPISQDEDADNKVIRTWGTPRDPEGLLNHHDLLWRIGGYEPERGVGVAGHRGYFLRDVGVMLNQAFINYSIAFLRKRNYTMLQPPYMMKKSVMSGVAQLEQFDEELYKVSGGHEDMYLIATSEQPICGYHMNDWLDEKQLPLRYSGVSTCFRKEAGSGGKDTWGIFRVHQFEKVEQFVIVEGDLAASQAMQEEMSLAAEEFYQSLGFPYQVINIVSGALNNAAVRKYDIECWFPGYNAYRELVSCSNCTDYQSRAMEIRCGIKKLGDREKKYVHMLNSTLCATGRAICCLLETYQEADGVRVPDVLVPFMGGMTFMPFVRDSKLAPSIPPAVSSKPAKTAAPKAKTADAAPAKAKDSTQPAAEVSGPEGELVKSIISKGDEIRDLKAAKADKNTIKTKVDELLALKAQYKDMTGKDYVAPGAAPQGSKKDKAPKEKASAPSTASPAPIPDGPEGDLVKSITSKGNEIRDLKAAKADKDTIKAKVDELLALKAQYKDMTGKDYAAPGAAPQGSKKDKAPKEKAPAKEKPKTAPAAKKPEPKPEKVAAPAPATVTQISASSSVWNKGTVDLALLEAKLKVFSYVSGYSPSAEDSKVLTALVGSNNQDEITAWVASHPTTPQISRWLRNVSSFSAAERMEWV